MPIAGEFLSVIDPPITIYQVGMQRFGILWARGAVLSPVEICYVAAFSVAVAVHEYIDFCEVGTWI